MESSKDLQSKVWPAGGLKKLVAVRLNLTGRSRGRSRGEELAAKLRCNDGEINECKAKSQNMVQSQSMRSCDKCNTVISVFKFFRIYL